MKPNRLFLLLVTLSVTLTARADLASIFTNTAPAKVAWTRRPSIIFIQCHGLALGDLSCYGQTNFQTPNLDRLAATGIRFTHYTGGADSAATTAELLAGKTSGLAGEPNLAQRLQQNGYRTGLIGEWGLGGEPWKLGFNEFAGFLEDAEGKNYYPDNLWRYAPNSILNPTNNRMETYVGKEGIYDSKGNTGRKYFPDLLFFMLDNYVRVNAPDAANHFRPFFLLANFSAPRTATAGVDDFPVPSDAPFTGESWPQAAKNRAALITRLDVGIGRLFEQLHQLGLTNNVAVFFTASAAPEKFASPNLNFLLPAGNFRDAKNSAPVPLPMIVNWPGTIPAGRTSNAPWSAMDFAPTALEIGHVKPTAAFTGISMLPTLSGAPGTNTPALPDRPY